MSKTVKVSPKEMKILPCDVGQIKKPKCPHDGCNYVLDTAIVDSNLTNKTNVTFGFWCNVCKTFYRYTADVFDTSGHYWLMCRAIEDTHLVTIYEGPDAELKKEYYDQQYNTETKDD